MASPPGAMLDASTAAFFAFAAASLSNEAPYLENTGTGQVVLSEEYLDIVLGWIFEEEVTALELRNLFPLERNAFLATVNPNLFGPIIDASAVPGAIWCDEAYITPNTDALCATITSNSATEAFDLINDYPLQWCHSPDDDVIPWILTFFGLAQLGKPNVTPYMPTLPFLEPQGSHGVGGAFCMATVPSYLQDNPEFLLPVEVEDSSSTKGRGGSKKKCHGKGRKGGKKRGSKGSSSSSLGEIRERDLRHKIKKIVTK